MKWSPQQSAALDACAAWLRSGDDQVFRLFGYAGTGKTTLARHLAEGVDGSVRFAAFTGKAAYVMRRAGCPGAQTLHSLIYIPKGKSRKRLVDLQTQLAAEDVPELQERLKKAIEKEKDLLKRPSFVLNEDSDLAGASLLVIDECSMVDQRMGEDILSFGVPVLVLGDPAQLPPIRGTGFFTGRTPNVMLMEIHRQAEGNPIITLATVVREGRDLTVGRYGDSQVLNLDQFDPDDVPEEQIIVGMNRTRRRANDRRRRNAGFDDPFPLVGDRLVCLRNNHDLDLLNGTIWTVAGRQDGSGDGTVPIVIQDEQGEVLQVDAHEALFLGQEVDWWDRTRAQEFDYGYALTAHKAQGSQWDSVLIIDESRIFRANARRWLYTAVTRAAKRVRIVLP